MFASGVRRYIIHSRHDQLRVLESQPPTLSAQSQSGQRPAQPQPVRVDSGVAIRYTSVDTRQRRALSDSSTISIRRRFDAAPGAVKLARDWVTEVITSIGYEPLVPTAGLLVSELTSNAIRHAKADHFDVQIDANSHLVVAVCDPSPVLPRLKTPDTSQVGGRGLVIVDQLAHAWGVKRRRAGKCLWFELHATSAL